MAIHAAKKWNGELSAQCGVGSYHRVLSELKRNMKIPTPSFYDALTEILPFGAIVAVGRLDGCTRIGIDDITTGDEKAFGDYTPGRFAWHFSNIKKLADPIPFRGQQGVFNIPDEFLTRG